MLGNIRWVWHCVGWPSEKSSEFFRVNPEIVGKPEQHVALRTWSAFLAPAWQVGKYPYLLAWLWCIGLHLGSLLRARTYQQVRTVMRIYLLFGCPEALQTFKCRWFQHWGNERNQSSLAFSMDWSELLLGHLSSSMDISQGAQTQQVPCSGLVTCPCYSPNYHSGKGTTVGPSSCLVLSVWLQQGS